MRNIAPLVLAALSSASVAKAQPAMVTPLGGGCTTVEGVPVIGHVGLPVLGQSFELTYSGPNHQPILTQDSTQPILVIGFSPLGPVDIPVGLVPSQPAGCALWSTHDIVVPMNSDPLVRGRYASSAVLPIGRDPGLIGLAFFAQFLAAHTQCGIAGCGPGFDWLGSSGSLLCTVGM